MAKSRAGRKKDALAALNPEPVEGGSDSESQSNDVTKPAKKIPLSDAEVRLINFNKAKAILNPIPKQNSDEEEAEPEQEEEPQPAIGKRKLVTEAQKPCEGARAPDKARDNSPKRKRFQRSEFMTSITKPRPLNKKVTEADRIKANVHTVDGDSDGAEGETLEQARTRYAEVFGEYYSIPRHHIESYKDAKRSANDIAEIVAKIRHNSAGCEYVESIYHEDVLNELVRNRSDTGYCTVRALLEYDQLRTARWKATLHRHFRCMEVVKAREQLEKAEREARRDGYDSEFTDSGNEGDEEHDSLSSTIKLGARQIPSMPASRGADQHHSHSQLLSQAVTSANL